MGEESVRIFIIKYGRNANWKVLLTTDTAMHFVRVFELYERHWGIEVIFKECRGYLGRENVRAEVTTLRLQTQPCAS